MISDVIRAISVRTLAVGVVGEMGSSSAPATEFGILLIAKRFSACRTMVSRARS